jgi:hypothetical protein
MRKTYAAWQQALEHEIATAKRTGLNEKELSTIRTTVREQMANAILAGYPTKPKPTPPDTKE